MASTTTCTPLSLSSSSKAPRLQPPPSGAGVTIPTPPPLPHLAKTTTSNSRNIGRNVAAMATGEVSASEVVNVATIETPEIVTKIQQACSMTSYLQWEKVEDKYAVTSLAVAGGVGLVACAGAISAIDRLPFVPGLLELVGIGYTGYFAYKNLASKPSRDALIQKIKNTYNDIIGSS
ncbi:protein CURVATURE THYLAKOID 1B, chloroplastic-like isoform X1 [Salvia hispanica]|uniref:protein CURVATURE THYLAKOID 1B, chloroplastic-like isoform X1 n=1 Tax=Salvia hispanica TaxID=49212 RepID=UPI002009BEE2|nr:protein CURVATURE THYLAKOID 1B, chloroplastic-like isoform X1 [Salvia hispanica]